MLGDAAQKMGQKFRGARKDVDDVGKGVDRNRNFFLRFVDGMRAAEQRGAKLSDEMRRTGGAFTRLGFAVRSTIRDVDRFINLRWFLVIGFLNVMGNAIAVLGANLLALASSATRAAAALGGALVAGIGQLIPVVLLLQGVMGRLDAVMKAVDATEKARLSASEDAKEKAKAQRDAEERLSDARYNLLRANESVLESEQALSDARRDVIDAERDHRRAVEDLAEARRKASENIIDSRLEEKEAALALQEAELAVLDAKEKLRLEESRARLGDKNIEFARAEVKRAQEALKTVQAQGDQALISSATQSLNFAENNLNAMLNSATDAADNLKKRQIDAQQAEINLEQARIRNQRQRRETRTVQREGVEGADDVVSARDRVRDSERAVVDARRAVIQQTHALRDANHNVALALREVRDAHEAAADAAKQQSSAQKALNDATKDLSAAEKAQVRAIDRLKQTYRKEFGPITDIITRAFTRAINRVEQLLLDPKIQKAAKALAGSIAEVIDLFSEFSQTTEFREALVFFTEEAADNVPKIGAAFLDLLKILIRVGRAATPLFNNLLDRIVAVFSRLEKGTRDQGRLEKFFATAGEHLDAWIGLANAIIGLVGAFVSLRGPAETGRGLLQDITDLLNDWADWIRSHPEEITKFFDNMRTTLEGLAGTFGRFAKILFEVFTSEESSAFSELILEVFLPAVGEFIVLLGKLSKILTTLFGLPVIGPALKFAAQVAIIYGLFNRLFALVGISGRAAFGKLFEQISQNNSLLRRFARALLSPVASIKQVREAMKQGVITAQIYAEALRTKLKLAYQSAVNGAKAAATFIAGVGKAIVAFSKATAVALLTPPLGVIAIILGVVAAIVLLDQKFHFIMPTLRFLLRLFQRVFNWIKDNWKLLTAILLGPFGLVIIAAIKWRDKIIGFFRAVVEWVQKNWKTLLVAALLAPFLLGGAIILGIIKFRGRLLELMRAIPGLIETAFKKLPGMLLKIFNKIPGLLADALKGLGGIVKGALARLPVVGRFFGGGDSEEQKEFTRKKEAQVFAQLPKRARRRALELKGEGMKLKDILRELVKEDLIEPGDITDLAEKFGAPEILFQAGGAIPGAFGKAVPIIAHAGEWVLNKAQQVKLAKRLGESTEDLSNFLFGTNLGKGVRPGGKTTGTRPARGMKPFRYRNFNLVPQEDPSSTDEEGNPVIIWFIEMDDGTFGQVSARDAAKIIKSNGVFIPGYVKRSTHGFTNPIITRSIEAQKRLRRGRRLGRGVVPFEMGGIVQAMSQMRMPSYDMGGIVQPVQSFAQSGGIELKTPSAQAASAPRIGEFKQHFEVHAESELDWNYIMRLGALHAQTGY